MLQTQFKRQIKVDFSMHDLNILICSHLKFELVELHSPRAIWLKMVKRV